MNQLPELLRTVVDFFAPDLREEDFELFLVALFAVAILVSLFRASMIEAGLACARALLARGK